MATNDPTGLERAPRATLEFELPSGRKVKLREPTGAQEMQATVEAGTAGGGVELRREWALMMRCVISIDGKPFDSASYTPESFRGLWSTKDYLLLRAFFMELYLPTDAETEAASNSKRWGSD